MGQFFALFPLFIQLFLVTYSYLSTVLPYLLHPEQILICSFPLMTSHAITVSSFDVVACFPAELQHSFGSLNSAMATDEPVEHCLSSTLRAPSALLLSPTTTKMVSPRHSFHGNSPVLMLELFCCKFDFSPIGSLFLRMR